MSTTEQIEQQNQYEALIEALPLAVVIFDQRLRVKSFNAAFVRQFEIDAAWLREQPSFGLLLDQLRNLRKLPEQSDFQAYRDSQVRFLDILRETHEEVIHLPDGGSLRRIAAPLANGEVMLAFENLTGVLGAERRARETLAVQRVTLDNLAEAIGVFGGDGILRFANPAFCDLWTIDLEGEALHLTDFVQRTRPLHAGIDDWDTYAAGLSAQYLSRTSEQHRFEVSDDTVLEFVRQPLPDGSMLFRYADVTQSVRSEKSLHARATSLAATDKLRSEFIANLSFEIRTPLNTIVGFANMLAGDYFGTLNRRQQEYADGIADASSSLAETIEQILDLANLEAGLLELRPDSIDVHSLLAGALGLVRERARHKHINLVFDCAPDIGWIVADERILKQVLLHLLGNALTFTGTGGKVTLSAVRGMDQLEITVVDTGVGIPQADLDRVFQGFERGQQSSEGGAGLGLTMVKSFVELHDGSVELTSKPNRGTTVRCSLPLDNTDFGQQ